ncbi:MAG TPA: GlsB/YeaQ/YmgE family stress response membrane protein [Xanthomonadales bacterium]|nr:GlsB/YeaQ/YmgE family stress response membrane protein [Xanthomonadales bacterium]
MGLIYFLIVGLIAGFLAKYVVPGEGPGGILGDIIIGVIGAFIGGWVFTKILGQPGLEGFSLWSILVAFVGAVILLFIMRLLTRRPAV